MRYFTLEISLDDLIMICEWIGNPVADAKHLNHGPLEDGELATFVQAIRGQIV